MVTDLGRELRKLRLDFRLYLKDMADKLGYSPSFLSSIENGKRTVPDDFIEKLGKAYSLDKKSLEVFERAKDRCSSVIKISPHSTPSEREFVAAFARKLPDLNCESKNKIRNLLEGGNDDE